MKKICSLAIVGGISGKPRFQAQAPLSEIREAEEASDQGKLTDPAIRTAKWAAIVTQWQWRIASEFRSRRPCTPGDALPARWHIMGLHGAVSGAAPVNLIAIRKRSANATSLTDANPFEIILIHVKNEGARPGNTENIEKLRLLAKDYRARDTILAEWVTPSSQKFYRLQERSTNRAQPWEEVDPRVLFA